MGAHESTFLDALVVVWGACSRPQIPDYLSDVTSISEETKMKKRWTKRKSTDGNRLRSGCLHVVKKRLCLTTLDEVSESDESDDDSYRPVAYTEAKKPKDLVLTPVEENQPDEGIGTHDHSGSDSDTAVKEAQRPALADLGEQSAHTSTPTDSDRPPDHHPTRSDSDKSLDHHLRKSTHHHKERKRKRLLIRRDNRTKPDQPPRTDRDTSHDIDLICSEQQPAHHPSRTDRDTSQDNDLICSEQKPAHHPTRTDSDESVDRDVTHTDIDSKHGHGHWFSFSRRHSKSKK